MKKKDIENLDKWDIDMNREYDFIYIVPTRIKKEWYNQAYYLWKIWNEIKIIDIYDCGWIFQEINWYFYLHWDFEDIFGWIKFWSNSWKLIYEYGGRLAIK